LSPQALLAAILDLTRKKGYPPTLRELAHELGVSVAAVHKHLVRLRAEGVVEWQAASSRTLQVVDRRP
jgi:repressor LexA